MNPIDAIGSSSIHLLYNGNNNPVTTQQAFADPSQSMGLTHGGISLPTSAPPAGAASGTNGTESWADFARQTARGLQDQWAGMQKTLSTPIPAPDFPGGQALADMLNSALQFEMSMQQFQVTMSAADNLRATVKSVTDKMTEMKD